MRAFFLLLLAVSLPAQALPATPYCPAAPLGGLGSAGLADPESCEEVTGRIFPEAFPQPQYFEPDRAGHANTGTATDFVSIFEFRAALDVLASRHPDLITVHEVGTSAGLEGPGGIAQFPVLMVEVTNGASPVPVDERQALLFMLSIHGVEKGGREGGMRVIEDLVKGIGMAAEPVQNGAGLPGGLPGGDMAVYRDYLDFMRLFFLFPNPDGWAHDEVDYVVTSGSCGGNGRLFCRTNGNGIDLNRQAPTVGWQDPDRQVVHEPEAVGYYNWMQDIDWTYAIDIHGMNGHRNFVAIMLPAAAMSPQEMQRSMRLAETLKERLNSHDHFSTWTSLFATGEAVEEATAAERGAVCAPAGLPFVGPCPLAGSRLDDEGSSQFAEYYTVIDAIGYTDSGFNGDFFAQTTGLNAPGYDIELAHNHAEVDSTYAHGSLLNDYHITAVREIVKSYLDAAALDVQVSFETGGKRTMYLESPHVATNLDDADPTPGAGSWAIENPHDDRWEYSVDRPFRASPAQYWQDMAPFVRDGDRPGVLVRGTGADLGRERLMDFDVLVVPGSAIQHVDGASVAVVRAWVEEGGTLILTDEALRLLDLAGITSGAVDVAPRYMGGIRMDLEHPLLEKVRGGVKQTYEPTPLGFAEGAAAAPNWFIERSAFEQAGGSVAGLECGGPRLTEDCSDRGVALGTIPLGAGQIHVIGALLPDPTEEFYHPYGLDPYATTYSGNQILRNMLGWEEVFVAPPVIVEATGIVQSDNEPASSQDQPEGTVNATPGLLALAPLLLALLRRRR